MKFNFHLINLLLILHFSLEGRIWAPDCTQSCVECKGAICGRASQHCCSIDECDNDNLVRPCPDSAKIFVKDCTIDPKAVRFCDPKAKEAIDTDKKNNILATNDIYVDPFLAITLNNPNFIPTGFGNNYQDDLPKIINEKPKKVIDFEGYGSKAKEKKRREIEKSKSKIDRSNDIPLKSEKDKKDKKEESERKRFKLKQARN